MRPSSGCVQQPLGTSFGIGMNTDHTLEEVGQQFSVTRDRIRQAFAGEGAAEAEASQPVEEDAVVPRSVGDLLKPEKANAQHSPSPVTSR